MNYQAELFGLVERVLAGTMPPDEFESAFYNLYFDEVPDSALTQAEHEFIGEICEKLDVTGAAPDAESRRYGWIDHAEFVAWLRAAYASYVSA